MYYKKACWGEWALSMVGVEEGRDFRFRGDLYSQVSTFPLVLSMLLYTADTWTLLSADVRTLDVFYQKCLRQLLGIRWYDRVRNDEVLQRTCLTSLSHLLSRRRTSVFGHVARLDDDTPANVALQLHINVSLNRPPDHTWRRPPGRPRKKWLDQLRNDSTRPTGDLWRRAVDHTHGVQRRDGPGRLLDDDDDDYESYEWHFFRRFHQLTTLIIHHSRLKTFLFCESFPA